MGAKPCHISLLRSWEKVPAGGWGEPHTLPSKRERFSKPANRPLT